MNQFCRTIVRFIYYRMVAQHVVPKDAECVPQEGINPRTGKPYKSVKVSSVYVSEALPWLREQGQRGPGGLWLPYVYDEEIVDESRSTMNNVGFADVRAGLVYYLPVIEIDPWNGNPPVLVVESRSLRSFFRPLAEEFRIDVITLGGQAGRGYLANDAVDHLNKDTPALAVVDYDKAGGDIENSARRRLRVLAPHWHGEWERVAVTDDQFQTYGIDQGLMVTKADDRFSPPRYFDTLEAEGVEQSALGASVKDVLDARLGELGVSLDDIRAEEERQRREAQRRIGGWGDL